MSPGLRNPAIKENLGTSRYTATRKFIYDGQVKLPKPQERTLYYKAVSMKLQMLILCLSSSFPNSSFLAFTEVFLGMPKRASQCPAVPRDGDAELGLLPRSRDLSGLHKIGEGSPTGSHVVQCNEFCIKASRLVTACSAIISSQSPLPKAFILGTAFLRHVKRASGTATRIMDREGMLNTPVTAPYQLVELNEIYPSHPIHVQPETNNFVVFNVSTANGQNAITPAVICAIVFGILSIGCTIGTAIWVESRRKREQALPRRARPGLEAGSHLTPDAQSFIDCVRMSHDPDEAHDGIELPPIAHISTISLPGPHAMPVRHLPSPTQQ
ncbi:hypothetical protein PG994_002203 [Apiospora phragmitis]|uniref:Uncharacterized protein n=1 Tax=Apiospora phragmitis TaxID=2905665 RepID=A0ABR1WVS2_9PEZI